MERRAETIYHSNSYNFQLSLPLSLSLSLSLSHFPSSSLCFSTYPSLNFNISSLFDDYGFSNCNVPFPSLFIGHVSETRLLWLSSGTSQSAISAAPKSTFFNFFSSQLALDMCFIFLTSLLPVLPTWMTYLEHIVLLQSQALRLNLSYSKTKKRQDEINNRRSVIAIDTLLLS